MSKLRKIVDTEQDTVLEFKCPGCGDTHQIPVRGPRVTWQWNGDLERPTLSPSLLATTGHYVTGQVPDAGCWCTYNELAPFSCYRCHSFVRDGHIQFLSDCTHALVGKTVELPELPDIAGS